MEPHIQPDWLLICEQNDTELTLLFVATCSHSDLFGKNRRSEIRKNERIGIAAGKNIVLYYDNK